MAVKKNELYASLWASCDALRGGMDASQYKDYILTLLFVKYVTDKFKGEPYADIVVTEGSSFDDMILLKNKKDIGEKLDTIIGKLAEDNNLRGVIDNAHFNDEAKLGKGKEMVDKLTKLIGIFQRPEFDFKNNKAGGDDILGDAYEYLMRKFATESGKSKGQFYTPAEVSRILAKVIGIDKISFRSKGWTVYDPACGSGSLLIRAANSAPIPVSIYGQEKDGTTAGLAKMNLVLHNKADGEIKADNTFSAPKYLDGDQLKQFDFVVANPPFSLKNWKDGLKEYGRFDGYGEMPPEKNGDFAWLLHILKSLKSTGKAAVILPHGVLFRGNAEATIRKNIIDKGYIKGIIGLPANLFYGTGIPACIIIIDKQDAETRDGIFMIDSSHDFIKDGNKNRLRERDIEKIVKTYQNRIIDDPKYARYVLNDEIKKKNDYNLNIPRYIDSSEKEDIQDINAHLNGGIPSEDIDNMDKYWDVFSNLKTKLFSQLREKYYKLNIQKDDVRTTIYTDEQFNEYANKLDEAFTNWCEIINDILTNINNSIDVKTFIVGLSDKLVEKFEKIKLVDKYDVYEVLLSYWQETMADDVLLIKYDGYDCCKEINTEYKTKKSKNEDGEEIEVKTDKVKSWDGKVIPKSLIVDKFFGDVKKKVDEAQIVLGDIENDLNEFVEENTDEEGVLREYLNDKDEVDAKKVLAKTKELKKAQLTNTEDYKILSSFNEKNEKLKDTNKVIKDLYQSIDDKAKVKYSELTEQEIKDLLVDKKWYSTIYDGIKTLYETTSHNMANRIAELAERYENTLPEIETEVSKYEQKVKEHLLKMGYKWEK